MAMIPGIELEALVRDDGVHRRVYTDPEIFEMEMKSIFTRTWVYVAHESEVAQGGDYKTTWIGRQPVIVTRNSDDGQIYVLNNSCRHRAALVCYEERGNSNYFRCVYHGWTYSNRGDLTGVTFRDGYGADFDYAKRGLIPVAKVGNYRGFIFASMSEDVPSIEDYLGYAREYIDWLVAQAPGGLEIKAGIVRHRVNSNWKLPMENTIDNFHFDTVHHSVQEVYRKRTGKPFYTRGAEATSFSFENGHGGFDFRGPGTPIGVGGASQWNLVIFPNLALSGVEIRVFRPISVDKAEYWRYPITLNGAPQELNEQRLRMHERVFSPAGFVSPDDVEILDWHLQHGGLQSEANEWLLLGRGMNRQTVDERGVRWADVTDEVQLRGFYRQWKKMMAG